MLNGLEQPRPPTPQPQPTASAWERALAATIGATLGGLAGACVVFANLIYSGVGAAGGGEGAEAGVIALCVCCPLALILGGFAGGKAGVWMVDLSKTPPGVHVAPGKKG